MDTVFQAVEVKDRTQIFYIFFNSLYGGFLDLFGWSKANAHLVCTFFIALSAVVWFFIFRKIKFSFEVALLMALTFMLFPAYFKAANHLRPDAMAFCLGSLSLLIFLSRYYLLAGFMLMVAIESHLMSCIFGVYMIVLVGYNWKAYYTTPKSFFKEVLLFSAGVILGFAYYFWLKPGCINS